LKLDPKNAFSGFCQKFPQAMGEIENFFCQFPNPSALRVSGMGGIPQNVKKVKITAPYWRVCMATPLSGLN
jgi:hypothetical protein